MTAEDLSTAGASTLTAPAGGNGAQRSGLSPQSGDSSGNQCQPGPGTGGNGFVIVNAPGKPGAARFVNGEVSLKNATPKTTYMVYLATDSSHCVPAGTITTNPQGNGNDHLDGAGTSGSYYVVIREGMNEVFASAPVTAN